MTGLRLPSTNSVSGLPARHPHIVILLINRITAMKTVITISRQYGSGGREIGQALAAHYGIPFYDKNVAELSAAITGFTPHVVEKLEDSVPDIMSYQYYGFLPQPMPLSDQVFFAQADVIRRVAAEGPCVIVGRCADYILRQHPRCLHFFIHAPLAQRVSRVMEREHCTEAEARAHIKATDRNRAAYHEFYAQGGWGKAESYHAALSSAFGISCCTEALIRLIDLAEEQAETTSSHA